MDYMTADKASHTKPAADGAQTGTETHDRRGRGAMGADTHGKGKPRRARQRRPKRDTGEDGGTARITPHEPQIGRNWKKTETVKPPKPLRPKGLKPENVQSRIEGLNAPQAPSNMRGI